ncbi:hypothetical protein DV096_07615 [Bradymonadaceae bacterium TMQ3]|uniref:Uncharacterized protein n=1 Tax=Lujinxingia sediminis TaxID=2480984 RepID=A0ABY0CT48_9DELT|nr:hypothetical protein [Lujinxingia sediminis]RDV38668.1 hypothetical protein DV096_07615 [Bradymonadaceae bacterium TMQ3]RVU44780.1 hypothetical protein EA187_09575 [Lujinxingia sediminis]TXC76559.1 hypothetical protein FRC91_07455 [Bradymonadales bacterium TMQ1]
MKRAFLTGLVALGMILPATSFAQSLPEAGAASGQAGDEGVVYQEETTYDFDGEDLTGNLIRPDGENITGDQRGKTSSLINIRQDFIPEMLKSVETL